MEKIIHKADTRGSADHGWLKAKHYFSFARYFNPDRMGFGTLRVINDDIISPSMGFGTHPHDNMEIITIPLEGELAHQDSTGNGEVIKPGEVQVMSAGTGIWHSEFNNSEFIETKLFQIWIIPNQNGHEPRYGQKYFSSVDRKNKFQLLVSPNKDQDELWINQNAYITRIDLDPDKNIVYEKFDNSNGIYFVVISGEMQIANENLSEKDAIGIVNGNNINIKSKRECKLLILEVPMM